MKPPRIVPGEQNLAEKAYRELRAELLSCRISPGARLNISELCSSSAWSQGAVREALSRLVSEQLVIAEFNRGFRAAPVSEEQFRALMEARSIIDAACLRLSIAHANLEWEVKIVGANHRMMRVIESYNETEEDAVSYEKANAAFNQVLMSACGNPWLLKIQGGTYDQLERYRRLCLPTLPEQMGQVRAYRSEFLQALLERDADRAVTLMTQHYRQIGNLIAAKLAKNKDATLGEGGLRLVR